MKTRSELDKFTPVETLVLFKHGYSVAKQSYEKWCEGNKLSPATPTDASYLPLADRIKNEGATSIEVALIDSYKIKSYGVAKRRLSKAGVLLLISLLVALYGCYVLGTRHVPPPLFGLVDNTPLTWGSINERNTTGWTVSFPALPVNLQSGNYYELESLPLGTITHSLAHPQMIMTVAGISDGTQIYFYLRTRSSPDNPSLSTDIFVELPTTQSPMSYLIPPGLDSDRIVAIAKVSDTPRFDVSIDDKELGKIKLTFKESR